MRGRMASRLARNATVGAACAALAALAIPAVAVGQTLYNQTGATIPVVILWMLFYVSVSLSISAVVNWYNRRVRLVER